MTEIGPNMLSVSILSNPGTAALDPIPQVAPKRSTLLIQQYRQAKLH